MNFWKYTFTGKFMFYAAIAGMVAITGMLICYITEMFSWAWIIFFAFTTLFKISTLWQLIQWRRYRRLRKNQLNFWGDRTRLN